MKTKYYGQSMGNRNGLVKHVIQNSFFFCSAEEMKTHTSLENFRVSKKWLHLILLTESVMLC